MKAIFTGGLRTAFAQAHKGAFVDVRPDDLLVELFREQKSRQQDLWSETPSDVIVGCAYPEGEQGYNVARMAAIGAGIKAPGATVNRLCGSSLEALAMASAYVEAGRGSKYLIGGVESMTRVPRRGANFSESSKITESMPTAYVNMGETAEYVAAKFPNISRLQQEDFAVRSHELAQQAYDKKYYNDTVINFKINRDQGIRGNIDRKKIASLVPAFSATGVVTAATSSPLSDGAVSGWVISEEIAAQSGVQDGLRILDIAVAHVEPEVMGMGPKPAIENLLFRNRLSLRDICAIEMNEAFAIQVLACMDGLKMNLEVVNTWGGALAIGHPLGATGLRLMMTLQSRLRLRGEKNALGIASLCVGGGQGVAVLCQYYKK